MGLCAQEYTCGGCLVGYEPSAMYSFSFFMLFKKKTKPQKTHPKKTASFCFQIKIFEGILRPAISSHFHELYEDEGAIMPSLALHTVFI